MTAPPRALLRWFLAYGTFGIPQAAGPIAFALLAIPITGNPGSGAAIVLAITIAQVVGAVPIARLGRRRNAAAFLRLLVGIRMVALLAIVLLAATHAPFAMLLAAAALAGLVNGAAFGYLRAILNHLADPGGMPRALGIASTLSELTFVVAPVLASILGTIDPVFALLVLSLLGAAPALLIPRLPHAMVAGPAEPSASLLQPKVLLWLGCTTANGAVVSSIEIGAVALAMSFGLPPAMGFIFTVALCIASVAGGIWVSVRNRMPRPATILAGIAVMAAGAILIAANLSVPATIAGAIMAGCCLAPLGTAYSLRLDALAPHHRKAEIFALSRTANSLGVILTSSTLTMASLAFTQALAAALICIAAITVAIVTAAGRARA